jgi:hypothetical protein
MVDVQGLPAQARNKRQARPGLLPDEGHTLPMTKYPGAGAGDGATPPSPRSSGTVDDVDASVEDRGLDSVFDLVDLMLRATKDGDADLGAKDMIVALAARAGDLVPNARWCSVTLVRAGSPRTLTASSEAAERIDAIQYDLGSGPCVDAIVDDHVYLTGDVAADGRWPQFGPRAADEVGVRSVLAFRLVLLDESRVIAGLNLYSDVPDAFDDQAVRTGTMLATQCSLLVTAYLASDEAGNLARALETNRDIGVAIGVLMAKHDLSRDQALAALRVASQDSNRRIADLALEVAETGELPLRRLRRQR